MVSLVGKTRGPRKKRNQIHSRCPMSGGEVDRRESPTKSMTPWLADTNEPSPGRGCISSFEDNAFLPWHETPIPDAAHPLERIETLSDVLDVFPPFPTPETSECPVVPCRPSTAEELTTPFSTASHHQSDSGNLFHFSGSAESTADPTPLWSRHISATSAPVRDQTGGIFSHCDNQERKTANTGIAACVELVACLEARQRDGPHAVDQMLATNREATNKINELIVLDGPTLSSTSSLLLTAAAENIFSLFEIIVRSKSYDQYTMPCVGFGTFLIDPEEQKAIRTRVVSKELRLNTEMIRRLSRAITQRRGSVQDKLKKWLQELEQRTENLSSMVENE